MYFERRIDTAEGLWPLIAGALVLWIGLCSVLRPRQHSIGYMRDNEQNEVDGMKKGADSTVKERLVICNEEDTDDGRARVTRDEERVLPVD